MNTIKNIVDFTFGAVLGLCMAVWTVGYLVKLQLTQRGDV